jgi:hypothetical protein
MWPYGDNTKTPTIIARGLECWAFHDYRLEEPAGNKDTRVVTVVEERTWLGHLGQQHVSCIRSKSP